MTRTRAVLGTALLVGFAAGVWSGNGWLILATFLGIVGVLLSADRGDRRDGPRDTHLPSWDRQEH